MFRQICWNQSLSCCLRNVLLPGFILASLTSGLSAHDQARLRSPTGEALPRGEASIDDDGIRVRGEGFAAGLSVSVWIADGAGVLQEVFQTTASSKGQFEVRAKTETGLPLGASLPADFAGRAVSVNGPDGVLLVGSFSRQSPAAELELGVGTSSLSAAPGSPFPAATGRVRAKASQGRHAIEVKVRALASGAVYGVSIVSAAGESESLGSITVNESSIGALEVDTGDGGILPFGAAGVSDLAGLDVLVKDDGGILVLSGKFPQLGEVEHEKEGNLEVEFDLSRPADAPEKTLRGDVRIESAEGDDLDKVRVRLREATVGSEYTVIFSRLHSPSAIPFAAALDGAQETPPVETGAMGSAAFTFNSETGELSFSVVYSGLSSPETGSHIHRAAAGIPGPVEVPLPETPSPKEGSVTLSAQQGEGLASGLLYVNIHTQNHPAGEIRGQILPVAPASEEWGKLTAGADGRAERQASPLPLGARSLSELGGVLVKVLNASGALVLEGVVPQVGTPPAPPPADVSRLRFKVTLGRPASAVLPEANGSVEFEEEADEHEIEVQVEDIVPGAGYRVELRDTAGSAEVLASEAADSFGNLRKKLLFLGRERLPFGVASFTGYAGFSIVVLNADGVVVLEATVELPGGGAAVAPSSFLMVGAYDAAFLRGDSNGDSRVDIADAVKTLGALFMGQSFPTCMDGMDTNDDGQLDISDPVFTLVYLFMGGRDIPFPGTSLAGFDLTSDTLACQDS